MDNFHPHFTSRNVELTPQNLKSICFAMLISGSGPVGTMDLQECKGLRPNGQGHGIQVLEFIGRASQQNGPKHQGLGLLLARALASPKKDKDAKQQCDP